MTLNEAGLRRTGAIHSILIKLSLLENKAGSNVEQIKILRRQRFKLLDDIQEKQQSMDELDYMIGNNN